VHVEGTHGIFALACIINQLAWIGPRHFSVLLNVL
jgi:hypothetical protein